MKYEFQIGPPDAGRRLDRYLQKALGDIPRSLVNKLIRKKEVKVNGKRMEASYALEAGDTIVAFHKGKDTPATKTAHDDRIFRGPPPHILYQDEDFIILDKAAGLACSDDGTDCSNLPLWLKLHFKEEIAAGQSRPELCHRLDRGTSGVVVASLSASAFRIFQLNLENGTAKKLYKVLVWGLPEQEKSWLCEIPLYKRPHCPSNQASMIKARAGHDAIEAKTQFDVLSHSKGVTLLKAEPLTGRTHQIRAHCTLEGLPVLGDPRYGSRKTDNTSDLKSIPDHQLLHSFKLSFQGRDKLIEVEAKLPRAFRDTLSRLDLENMM